MAKICKTVYESVHVYAHVFELKGRSEFLKRYLVRGIYVKIYLGNSFVSVSYHVLCAKDVVLCQTPGKIW